MIARYEELRRLVLEHCSAQTQGLALFMRRGMRAWMQAWGPCAPPASPVAPPDDQQTCPVQLHAEVAMLLASMVLFARQETLA